MGEIPLGDEMRWEDFLFPILYFFFEQKTCQQPVFEKNVLTLEKKWDSCIFQTSEGLVAGCGRIGIFWCDVSTLFSPPKVFPQLCQGVDLLVGAVPAICRRHPHVRWLLGLQGRNDDFRGTTHSWKMTPQRVSCYHVNFWKVGWFFCCLPVASWIESKCWDVGLLVAVGQSSSC